MLVRRDGRTKRGWACCALEKTSNCLAEKCRHARWKWESCRLESTGCQRLTAVSSYLRQPGELASRAQKPALWILSFCHTTQLKTHRLFHAMQDQAGPRDWWFPKPTRRQCRTAHPRGGSRCSFKSSRWSSIVQMNSHDGMDDYQVRWTMEREGPNMVELLKSPGIFER